MSTLNPYVPPAGKVQDDLNGTEEFSTVKIFSSKGRIGRLSYFAYSMGLSLVFMVAISLVAALSMLIPGAGEMISMAALVIGYMGLFYVSILLLIQRSHDMGKSGWFTLLAFVPFLGLIFLFWPGSKATNAYGAPPAPSNSLLTWAVIILMLVMVVGILAAIAIPAYAQYVEMAKMAAAQ